MPDHLASMLSEDGHEDRAANTAAALNRTMYVLRRVAAAGDLGGVGARTALEIGRNAVQCVSFVLREYLSKGGAILAHT